jgi:RimJ/RimL family protein N-acetyltransferase
MFITLKSVDSEGAMWDFPNPFLLDGSFVRLERLNNAAHSKDLFEMATADNEDNSIFRFMMFGPFSDEDALERWVNDQEKLTDRVVFAVYSKRLKKYVGTYSIINLDVSSGKAELGSIWYGKIAQRTEINTEATFLLLRYLFEELSFRRVEWKCDNTNEASKGAALRLGFTFEGVFRKHMLVRGKNRDTAWFSMIDDEWPEKKTKIPRRIDQRVCRLNWSRRDLRSLRMPMLSSNRKLKNNNI